MVFVDEVQDLTGLQIRIISSLVAPGGRICYFGDPQQAIYSFMGAKMETLIRLSRRCDATRTYRINYRSPEYLLQGFNRYAREHFADQQEWSKLYKEWQQLPSAEMRRAPRPDNATAVLFARDADEEIRGIADLLDSFPDDETNAILARDNLRVRRVINALKRESKYIILASNPTEHTYFLRLLAAHLDVCLHPEDLSAWSRVLPYMTRSEYRMRTLSLIKQVDQFGLTPMDLMTGKLPEETRTPERDAFLSREGMRIIAHELSRQYFPIFTDSLMDIGRMETVEPEKLYGALYDMLLGKWFKRFVREGYLPTHQKRFRDTVKRLLQAKLKADRGVDRVTREEINARLERILSAMTALSPEEIVYLTELDRKKVHVMTVHQAKGRGFDNVFMFEARDDVYRPYKEEDCRIYYVGISRARKRVILTLSGKDFEKRLEELRGEGDEVIDLGPRHNSARGGGKRNDSREGEAEVPSYISDIDFKKKA